MDINSTTAQISTPAEAASVNFGAQTQKIQTKGDSSFKNEMDKVSTQKSESKADEKVENKTNSNTDENTKNSTGTKPEKDISLKIDNSSDDKNDTPINTISPENTQARLAQNSMLKGEINFEIDNTYSEMNNKIGLAINDISIQVNGEISPQAQVLIDANTVLSSVVSDTKIPVKVDYTTVQMDMDDTKFFTDLVQDTDKTLQNVITELYTANEPKAQEIQKNVKVSATLMTALTEAVKNNQSFRIDFDKDISVIIKVDKDGALTAKFIPGDGAVENYLKQNISTLRQRFDEQELSYKELSYTGQQKRERRNNNNKENSHE